MKKILSLTLFAALFMLAETSCLYAQGRVVRRLREEAEKKVIEGLFETKKEEEKETLKESADTSPAGRHRRGGGLSQEVPDVNAAIAEAEDAFQVKDFKGTKVALRKALWGVELEMGKKVLESLPETISGLKANVGNDQVTSSGIGFVGLLIERSYQGDEDMGLVVTIGNDAGFLGVAGMFMAGEQYRQSMDEGNQKQIRFQEQSAVIAYDEYDGYSLTSPFGQSSIFILQGVNFESEQDFMSAANRFDLNGIHRMLGGATTTEAAGLGEEASMAAARRFYGAGDLDGSRFSLQQAMNDVDMAIGKEILGLLPATMGSLPFIEGDEVIGSGAMGFAGMYVSRTYRSSDMKPSIGFQIIGDSPMLAGINTILALPVIGSDPNNKRVRLAGYRGMLQKSESDGEVSWDLQVPFGSSLLSVSFSGIPEEKAVMEMANTIPLERISKLVQ
jgi:hypothetical protein